MATGREWEDHFHKQFTHDLENTKDALGQLQQDELIYKEFKELGLFQLSYFIDDELRKRS